MPPATATTCPVTCPAARGEQSHVTAEATSSAVATLRSGIVAVTCASVASVSSPAVIGETVQPGATTFTRARGALATISFFNDSASPCAIAALAAA